MRFGTFLKRDFIMFDKVKVIFLNLFRYFFLFIFFSLTAIQDCVNERCEKHFFHFGESLKMETWCKKFSFKKSSLADKYEKRIILIYGLGL